MKLIPPGRAMQGGAISGSAQAQIDAAGRRLVRLLREQMKAHAAPEEHYDQETASLAIQVLIELVDDPTAFLEGAMTQLGWQVGSRSAAAHDEIAKDAIESFATGMTFGLREPIAQDAAGSA
jgi:hypothetical protein